MKIELITGGTIFEASRNVIKQIDVGDFDKQNIIVAPDTFSMQAEKLVFDCLNIKAAFNISVVGISKLAGKILRDNNICYTRVSAIEEVFNIYQAVKNNEQNFRYFKSCSLEFCLKILQIIKQFKACRVKVADIKDTGDELLDSKLHDLKIIYQDYENLLGEKLDLSRLLEFSTETAQKTLNLQKINLYFVNFDSFSTEIGNFICKLAKSVNKICIGYAQPSKFQANAFIYEDAILKKIVEIANMYSISVPTKEIKTSLEGDRLKIMENLFAFDVEKGKSDYFENIVAKNQEEEIEYVAKYIKQQTYNGAKFNDFAVAISDQSYYLKVKDIFDKFGITYYSDDAANLSQTILGKFIFKLLEIAKIGYRKNYFKYLIENPLLQVENREKILYEIDYFVVETEKEFLKNFPSCEKIIFQINMLKKCNSLRDFVGVLKQILDFVTPQYNYLVDQIDEEKLYKAASENKQAKELIVQVLDKLLELGGDNLFTLNDFEALLLLSLESVKVETIPSYIDSVFVGDVTSSYFEDVKTLFVLGASANALPKSRADVGIIDDDDIKKLQKMFTLEPDMKVINRRSRLKLFECLLHAKDKLIVCCRLDDGKFSNFVYDLRTMFGDNIVYPETLKQVENMTLKDLNFLIGTRNNLLDVYSDLKTRDKLPKKYVGALNALVKDIPEDKKFVKINNTAKIRQGSVSASQLETYFTCPFKRFVRYNLKVDEKETIEPDARHFGSLQHDLLCEFVKIGNVAKQNNDDIEAFLKKNLLSIAKKYYNEQILQRKHFIKYLKDASKLILKNVVYEAQHSKFRPQLLEEKIYKDFYDERKFIGYVDRVDVAEKFFRVIDYKTGEQKSLDKNLFYGTKLQLFLYAKMMQDRLQLDCAGVYYFNCQTKYSKVGEDKKLLVGLTKQDNDVATLSDIRLDEPSAKSDILALQAKKTFVTGEYHYYDRASVVRNFKKRFEYVERIAEIATKEIDDGYIEPKPIQEACKNCPYISVCKHSIEEGQRKTQDVRGRFDG